MSEEGLNPQQVRAAQLANEFNEAFNQINSLEAAAEAIPENERTYFVVDYLFAIPSSARFLVWAKDREDFEKNFLPKFELLPHVQARQIVDIPSEIAISLKDDAASSYQAVPDPWSAPSTGAN
jgi:hypothetical protein